MAFLALHAGDVDRTAQMERSDRKTDDNDLGQCDHDSSDRERKRTVHFNCVTQLREIMNLHAWTERERENCWYTPEEQEQSEAQRVKMLERIESGKLPQRNMTYRGLLYLTTSGADELAANIDRYFYAVMNEQQRQWNNKIQDWDLMAAKAVNVSKDCMKKAFDVAAQDAVEAKEGCGEGDVQDYGDGSPRMVLNSKSKSKRHKHLSSKKGVKPRKKSAWHRKKKLVAISCKNHSWHEIPDEVN